jgi:hypothetical protein
MLDLQNAEDHVKKKEMNVCLTGLPAVKSKQAVSEGLRSSQDKRNLSKTGTGD